MILDTEGNRIGLHSARSTAVARVRNMSELVNKADASREFAAIPISPGAAVLTAHLVSVDSSTLV